MAALLLARTEVLLKMEGECYNCHGMLDDEDSQFCDQACADEYDAFVKADMKLAERKDSRR